MTMTSPATVVQVLEEPLTYERYGPHSFFKDQMVRNGPAQERLTRHLQEMDVVRAARRASTLRRLGDGFEYRVTPDTQPGTGGNFTVPLWLIDLFATAPRTGQVLVPRIKATFDLPGGVSSVNLPIIQAPGTRMAPARTDAAVIDGDLTDAPGSSTVVTLAGQEDSALQLLEQSPSAAAFDWAVFTDLMNDCDQQLEYQLVAGLGSSFKQLVGLANVATKVKVTYTTTTPTGKGMYPYFGKVAAQIGNGRKQPPECWLMRTARYAWLMSAEDTGTRPLMTPDPIEGVASILGWPTFLDDTIPATLGVGDNQDQIIACKPSDLILFKGEPVTNVMREPLSGALGVRIQMHLPVAAFTNRYPSGIGVLQGTGLVVESGY